MRRPDIFTSLRDDGYVKTDRMFLWLLLAQWALAIVLALAISPFSWDGGERALHFHVKAAVGLGAVIVAPPIALILRRPGWWLTRHVVAIAQISCSALLVMITGGRIETHFHIFGSLAFLAFYGDWKVLSTATIAVAADHLVRGLLWPDSVYGTANPEWWRFLEHAAWVVFEDIVLVYACVRRQREIEESVGRYRVLVEDTPAIPFEWDLKRRDLAYIAPQAAAVIGCKPEELSDARMRASLHRDDRTKIDDYAIAVIRGDGSAPPSIDLRVLRSDGDTRFVRMFLSGRTGSALRGVYIDITREKELELELQQSQKLESVGRLAAGVAHEINTPVQFVGDSVRFVRDALPDLARALALHGGAAREPSDDDLDVDYVLEQSPIALDRALDGLDRVATIVRSMKAFAHPDTSEMASCDLNAAIESVLTIARNEYKYVADVDLRLGELPPVTCHAGELNQVVLNLVVNAAHAIGDAIAGTERRGVIGIATRVDGADAVIAISDTGTGIPDAVRARIFDPFFTTKPVGKGTGQGLAIARTLVVDHHRGALSFTSEVGKGTTFEIRVPVRPPRAASAMEAA